MPFLKVEVLLPLFYNLDEGAKERVRVEGEKYTQTYDEIVNMFGGCTIDNSPIVGGWIDPITKKQYKDDNTTYWVMCEDSQEIIEFFKKLKDILKFRFRQEEIMIFYIRVYRV